jgi:hypothetical protein
MDHQAFAQLLGNYGEFFSAIAVVVTLLYLTVQLRQNTKAVKAQTSYGVHTQINDYLLVQAQSAELADAWDKAVSDGYESLDVRQEFHFRGFAGALMFSYQNAFEQRKLGVLTHSEWVQYRSLLLGLISQWPVLLQIWKVYKPLFKTDFYEEIEAHREDVPQW